MDSNARIKVLLRSTHLHSNPKALQHLSNAQTKNMQPDDLLLGPGTDKLHFGRVLLLFLLGHDVIIHGCEPGVVDLDLVVAETLASLGFGQTDGANFGVGEDYGGNVFVGEFG